jgi:transcriptional regulator of acetoin/glycerol metabolism
VLQLAAVLAAFFVVYELVLTGLSEGSGVTLGERSVYLAGVVLFLFLACLMAWYLEPEVLREERWRWFAAIVLVLVWFGDVLLCFRGIPATQYASIDSEAARHEVIRHYLDTIHPYMGPLRMEVLYHQPQGSLRLMPDPDGLVSVVAAPAPVHDAAAILIQEAASLPMSLDMDAAAHPMTGIAAQMGLSVAQVIAVPLHGIDPQGGQLVVLGWADVEESGGLWTPDFDACDQLQRHMDASVWAACVIEAWSWLARHGQPQAEREGEREAAMAQLREALEETREAAALVRQDRMELAVQVQALRRWYAPCPPAPPVEQIESLLEAELIEALEELAQDDGPIVLAGAHGVGKTFVASCLHVLEGRPAGTCTLYVPTDHPGEDHRDNILGDEERGEPGALEVCVGGTLIIEEASWLAPGELMQVVEAARAQETRVVLCYTAEDAEQRSVLEGYPEDVFAALEAREIVIPKIARRTVRRAIVEHMVERLVVLHNKRISGVSPSAMSALCGFDCPGQLMQLESTIDVALRRLRGDFLEIGDLPQDVRRGVI